MQTSSLLANGCLALATLTFILLAKGIYLKPMPGGDYGVGYAWGAIILSAVFILLIGVSMLAIGWRGGFQWVASSSNSRMVLMVLTFLAIALTISVAGMGEGGPKLRMASMILSFAMPLAVLATGFLLANDPLEGGLPTSIARKMAMGVFGMSGVFASAFIVVLLIPMFQRSFATLTHDSSKLDSFEEGILLNIDTCNIQKDLVFMLVHTDDNQKPIIREHALAKIKTRADWQEELVRRLDSGWAEEVFTFLASNEVDDKSLFPEAVRLGVLNQAKIIRQKIRESRDLSGGQYTWEVDRVLRTVEKFEGMGVDYLPAVRELRAAFDEPSPFEKPSFRAAQMLDKWLKKR